MPVGRALIDWFKSGWNFVFNGQDLNSHKVMEALTTIMRIAGRRSGRKTFIPTESMIEV